MDSLEYNPDLIILAGFMKILQDPFLKKFHNSIINIHPSLLPSFKGLRSIERAFDMGVRITGCTIHWVNSDLDGGKIIAQAPVRIMEGDSLEIVTARVHAAEHMLLPWVGATCRRESFPFQSKMLKVSANSTAEPSRLWRQRFTNLLPRIGM